MEAYIIKALFTTELFEQGLACADIKSGHNGRGTRLEMARKVASLDKPYAITNDADVKDPRQGVFICRLEWLGKEGEEECYRDPWGTLFEYVATVPVQDWDNQLPALEQYLETLNQKGE